MKIQKRLVRGDGILWFHYLIHEQLCIGVEVEGSGSGSSCKCGGPPLGLGIAGVEQGARKQLVCVSL